MSVLPIAFFGATGGCANACLAHALQHGHYATVLARSPQKLREQLMARSISRDIVEKQLLIIEGDVKDVRAVGRVLQGNGNVNGTGNGKGVEVVISGIGGVPKPQLSLTRPLTMNDPTICGDATDSILTAMSQMQMHPRPLFVVISANGVRDEIPRDYPLVLTPLYRWLLSGVYDDKRRMEATLLKVDPKDGGIVVVRPSALTNGPSKGLEAIREGTMLKPVLGYSISRDDVGLWLFENLIEHRTIGAFCLEDVSITY